MALSGEDSMRVVELRGPGTVGIAIASRPRPRLGDHEVMLKVGAASLNYVDLMVLGGELIKPEYPRIAVCDGAGEIVAVGPKVRHIKIGDRVCTHFRSLWQGGELTPEKNAVSLGVTTDGLLREYAALPEAAVVPIPDYLSFEEAATIPVAGVTAWIALREAGVKAGDHVLLPGTGNVSLYGLQLAHALGARCYVTSSSDEKLAQAKRLGAVGTVNYRTNADWDKAVLDMTGGDGIDCIIEPVGLQHLTKALNTLRIGGYVGFVGFTEGWKAAPPEIIGLLLFKNVRLHGIQIGPRDMYESLLKLMAATQIKPVIARTFPLEQTAEAYEYYLKGSNFGKIVIRV